MASEVIEVNSLEVTEGNLRNLYISIHKSGERTLKEHFDFQNSSTNFIHVGFDDVFEESRLNNNFQTYRTVQNSLTVKN